MQGGIGGEESSKRNEFGISRRHGIFLQQEFDEFDVGLAAVGVSIGVAPDAVDGVVVVARGVVERAAAGGEPGEREIDGAVFGAALPERFEIGLGFVEASGVTEGAAEVE